MRILFLCQYFPPEMGAASARIYEHARLWVDAGHQVTVVCAVPHYPLGLVPKEYRRKLLFRESVDGIEVLRCSLYAARNGGVLRRSFGFFTFMLSAAFFGAVSTRPCDVVVATSPQMLCGLAGYLVSLAKRRPFVLEVRDLWPKQIVDLGVVRQRWIISLLTALEMFLYRRARAIVVVAEATRSQIAARGIPQEKIHTVTNGIDENLFVVQDRDSAARKRHGWQDKLVVLYIGTHGMSQGLETVLETAKLLESRQDILFVFSGAGAEYEMLGRHARERKLDNVTFLPVQAKQDMPAFYAAADICLVPLKKREVFLYNIPSKMFEIMGCARPMVLGVEGQAKALLDEARAGISVEPENPEAMAAAVLALADNPALRQELGRNGRDFVAAHYTRKSKADMYLRCLRQLVDAE